MCDDEHGNQEDDVDNDRSAHTGAKERVGFAPADIKRPLGSEEIEGYGPERKKWHHAVYQRRLRRISTGYSTTPCNACTCAAVVAFAVLLFLLAIC